MEVAAWFLTGALIFCIAQTGVAQTDENCGGTNCTAMAATPCCDTTSVTCVECCSDTECPPAASPNNDKCDVFNHVCVECFDDDDCDDGPMSVCNTLTNLCEKECNSTGDCSANEACVGDQCVCSTDMDPCNGDNEACNADGNCECDAGFVRDTISGDCVADCDPACTGGRICTIRRMCICPGGTVLSPNETTCLPCDLDCRMASDCRNVGEICNSDNECECPTGEKLFRGRCTGKGKLGGQCLSGRCRGRGVACNRTTNMCMCRGNCDVGTVCIKKRSGGKRRKGW